MWREVLFGVWCALLFVVVVLGFGVLRVFVAVVCCDCVVVVDYFVLCID